MGVTRVELQFTPETAQRLGTSLMLTANDISSLVYTQRESERMVFVYGHGIWTYHFNLTLYGGPTFNNYSFSVYQFTNIANFNELAYQTILNANNDYTGDVWASVVSDVLPVYDRHMNGEATGALFINSNQADGLIASYRTKHGINVDSEGYHYSVNARNTLLVRTHEYGLVLQNDNDAIESERLRIEYETRTGQQVNRD